MARILNLDDGDTVSDWGHYTYRTAWSEEDGEFVGTCDEFPSLSYLNPSPFDAMGGIMYLVETTKDDPVAEGDV